MSNHLRATGRTTRTLWTAMLDVSEKGGNVFVILANHTLRDWTYRYAGDLTLPLSRVKYDYNRRAITFPNGGVLRFIVAEDYRDRSVTAGYPNCRTIFDHPI